MHPIDAMHPEWLRAGKVAEYYVPFPDANEADRQLYFAVVRGEVRARQYGKAEILGPERLKEISKRRWDPHSDFGLPADLELNVEDVQRAFAGTLQADRSIIN
jgi:hypothetical protein